MQIKIDLDAFRNRQVSLFVDLLLSIILRKIVFLERALSASASASAGASASVGVNVLFLQIFLQ